VGRLMLRCWLLLVVCWEGECREEKTLTVDSRPEIAIDP
jgi:hypothetical protein